MKQRGITLIELVLVLIILGAVSTGIASFVRTSIDNVIVVTDRDRLVSASRFAVERIRRELSSAVPNSVRLWGGDYGSLTAFHCIQFTPIVWSTAYTELPAITTVNGNIQIIEPLEIDGTSIDLTGTQAIVYPLDNADVFDTTEGKRRVVASSTDDADGNNLIELQVALGFAEESPSQKVYFANQVTNFCVRNSSLLRFTGDIQSAVPTAIPNNAVIIAENIDNALSTSPGTAEDDPFNLVQASLVRNAMVQVRFRFIQNNEDITMQQEVHLPNAP